MKPKPIGIVGGAGPSAGVLLLERIFFFSRELYGCHKDADFPKVFLLSFPFSEMLSGEIDAAQVRKELSECLSQLRKNGAAVLAIACNTLHAFLDEKEDRSDLVHLPRTLAAEIASSQKPLVFCTSTSAQAGLHKKFFPCTYPDAQTQAEVDRVIDETLKGVDALKRLLALVQVQRADTIVLGCTELSLFAGRLQGSKNVLDPLEIAARTIVKKSFGGENGSCR